MSKTGKAMKWEKLKNAEYYFYREEILSKNLIEINKILFKENHWRIKFENLYVGEINHEDITHVK